MLKYFVKNDEATALQKLIDKVELEMHHTDVNSEEFAKLATQLERLYDIKTKGRDFISRDTLAVIAGNLAGILLIVAYEQKHVMNSKGLPQLIRPRVNG